MALIFHAGRANLPRTHALVIGVGGYRHLLGGAQEKQQTLELVASLKQLTSPPRSAVAFAQWLLEAANAWTAPLGSVDLLISAAPDDPNPLPAGLKADPATMANIRKAYGAWRDRCDRHEDNIAVFYFCGHGVEKKEQHLLAEDFGADPNNPWVESFAFDSSRRAFHSCRAKTQCFFIDACRKITSGMLTTEPSVIPLGTPDFTAPECAFNLTMQATARNEAALGPKRGVSYFTQALILALSGRVATKRGGRWVIETGQVSARITDILRMVKQSQGFPQRCSSQTTDSADILRVDTPKVDLLLKCSPDAANAVAQLTCSPISSPGQPVADHLGAPWSLQVDAGFYIAKASFDSGDFKDAEEQVFASPPAQDVPLWCAA